MIFRVLIGAHLYLETGKCLSANASSVGRLEQPRVTDARSLLTSSSIC